MTPILLKLVHYGHCDGYIQNVPLWFISGTLFWLILGFTDWEHRDCTTGDTAKNTLNESLGNIIGTFFGKIQDVPISFLTGTSWSHDLGHCECTDHSPDQGNCKEIGRENSRCSWDVLGGYMLGTLSISLQCTCDVLAWYAGPCPQCLETGGNMSGTLKGLEPFTVRADVTVSTNTNLTKTGLEDGCR